MDENKNKASHKAVLLFEFGQHFIYLKYREFYE